ncbi:hypothetical protein CAPTEDRAFT_188243 [Capitella teleta]|uniref:Uncharacterized protein n=1 Tax=Capitella teleta TaxID=283909 RepID=R7V3A4_CAPTE|nr:hypothetical protein CAPTEDRAFT_188243 [Capitella teleta]|eukprot:ELU12967.1 hypothetical protein CAPTEDRAFT_188243 [Capitella teleta]
MMLVHNLCISLWFPPQDKKTICLYKGDHPSASQQDIASHFSKTWDKAVERGTISDILMVADLGVVTNARRELQENLAGWDLELNYNMDQTRLFFRLEPSMTLATVLLRFSSHMLTRSKSMSDIKISITKEELDEAIQKALKVVTELYERKLAMMQQRLHQQELTSQLKEEVNLLEQYSRRSQLRIRGLKLEHGQNCKEAV